ncbi:hypothetical protein [Bosea sp. UNC402CLCol]|uniref:hypothetical protein n=1 Tax=Bosea sp. UNC402CLCol TaxID=1510531 RepID=UPI0012E0B0D9|nr:hypothetical protein [Bosea sp. UNC402CLCol]
MALTALLGLITTAVARAETPLPMIDVESRCTVAADRGIQRADCINSEQRAYDLLGSQWERVEDRFRIGCVKQFGGVLMAYTALARCAADSLMVQDLNRKREEKPFRYR